jgi:hypothetical protein
MRVRRSTHGTCYISATYGQNVVLLPVSRAKGQGMHNIAMMVSAFSLWAIQSVRVDSQPPTGAGQAVSENHSSVTVTLAGVDVNDRSFQLRYHVRNDSRHDVWLCDSMSTDESDIEVCWSQERRAFIIRKRVDTPWAVARNAPLARYVRLRTGTSLTEAAVVPIPVRPQPVVSTEVTPINGTSITRIILQIGYYEGDLPTMICEAMQSRNNENESQLLYFIESNERWRTTNDEVFFDITPKEPIVRGERVLELMAEVTQPLPYGTPDWRPPRFSSDLTACTRIEVSYQPSALGFFFPHADQQIVLTTAEREYLGALRNVTVKGRTELNAFGDDLSKATRQAIVVGENKACMDCYAGDIRISTLEIHRNSLTTETEEPFYCSGSRTERRPDFTRFMPQLQPFVLRIHCADNLRHLYTRFRWYHAFRIPPSPVAHGGTDSRYPASDKWCDDILDAYRDAALEHLIREPFTCPVVSGNKSSYAVNPDCTFESPADVVLLFETKDGWNQHGGPELFTFDNHDPKGGLVLLNDGTVKFIRTEEELKQLRWK